MPADERFEHRLLSGLLEDCHTYRPGLDHERRYGEEAAGPAWARGPRRARERARDLVDRLARRAGFARRHFEPEEAARRLAGALAELGGLERTYRMLADDHSRALLVELVKFRVLGPRHVALPISAERHRAEQARVDRELLVERGTLAVPDLFSPRLSRYALELPKGSLTLHTDSANLVGVLLLEQYAYARGPGPVVARARPGDVVIDGGACWGDTALYFAERVGAQGRVYSFELSAANVAVMEANLGLNPALADRVEIVREALWDATGEVVSYSELGRITAPGLVTAEGAADAATVALDDFVEERGIARIDFVKLDVEGAELRALRGAERTLRAFRPALAVAAYHRDGDLVEIPAFLEGLDLGYELFLDHFSAGRPETVLFARAGTPQAR